MAPPGRQVPDPAPRGAQGATGPLSMSLSDKRFAFVTEQKHRLPPFELGAGGPPACCPASLLSRETQRTMLLSCVASPSVPLQAGVSSSPPRVPANRCLPPPPPQNDDGSIDFREYVIGLAVLCNPANTEEIIQVAFKVPSAPRRAPGSAWSTSVGAECVVGKPVNPPHECIGLL